MKAKRSTKVCIVVLTYNRPKYIKRTIESLYARAGIDFDLYVFDDNSDKDTLTLLKHLEAKYKFNLTLNSTRSNIGMNFCKAITIVPDTYEYYVKLDSDVELLSDSLFKQSLDVITLQNNEIKKVSGISPRTEGVFRFEKYPNNIEFYNGHAIRYKTSVCFGCCMMFTHEVFESFKQKAEEYIHTNNDTKWGIDTALYSEILSFGSYIIIEDLSVYHIDNSFGQRKDFKYFTERKRWSIIDLEDVWYLKASKILYPKHLSREKFNVVRNVSSTFDDFISNCFLYIKDNIQIVKKAIQQENGKEEERRVQKVKVMKQIFRITSPDNFKPDMHIAHGTSKFYSDVPDWAKKNPRVIIESMTVSEDELENIE